MGPMFIILCIAVLAAAVYAMMNGHARLLTDLTLVLILGALVVGFVALEVVNLALWPFRYVLGALGLGPKKMEAAAASEAAGGRRTTSHRKIVIFDGICVMCNRFGRFVCGHLPDPNIVAFLPFQDVAANPHVPWKLLQKEFGIKEEDLQQRIAVVAGDKIYWGSDAVLKILEWCYFPFPIAGKLGLFVPHAIRDAAYMTVATNRYRVFGTQPLDKNFAKYLCPYIYVKKAFSNPKKSD